MTSNQLEKIPDVSDLEWDEVNKDNRKFVEEFLTQMVQLSPQTLKQYTSGLKIFFRYVKENLANKKRETINYQQTSFKLNFFS